MKTHKNQELIRENLGDLGLGDEFLDRTPKAYCIKEKFTMLDFIKLKATAL